MRLVRDTKVKGYHFKSPKEFKKCPNEQAPLVVSSISVHKPQLQRGQQLGLEDRLSTMDSLPLLLRQHNLQPEPPTWPTRTTEFASDVLEIVDGSALINEMLLLLQGWAIKMALDSRKNCSLIN